MLKAVNTCSCVLLLLCCFVAHDRSRFDSDLCVNGGCSPWWTLEDESRQRFESAEGTPTSLIEDMRNVCLYMYVATVCLLHLPDFRLDWRGQKRMPTSRCRSAKLAGCLLKQDFYARLFDGAVHKARATAVQSSSCLAQQSAVPCNHSHNIAQTPFQQHHPQVRQGSHYATYYGTSRAAPGAI